jgi:hypothetical protein
MGEILKGSRSFGLFFLSGEEERGKGKGEKERTELREGAGGEPWCASVLCLIDKKSGARERGSTTGGEKKTAPCRRLCNFKTQMRFSFSEAFSRLFPF